MHKLNFLDVILIIGYFIGCLLIGYFSSKKINNIKEYALSDKYMPTAMLVGTMLATHIGAGSILGTTEKAFSMGLIFVMAMAFSPFFWLITGKILGKGNIIYFKEKNCISISDIMELLYGKSARWITNIISLAFSIFAITMQITAMGYLFNYFLNVSNMISSLVGFSILVIYSFLGGVRVVIFTDFFQAIIFFIGLPLACYTAYINTGGLLGVIEKLPESHLTLDISFANIVLFISFLIYALIHMTTGPYIQRYLMTKDEEQLHKTFYMSFIIYIPFIFVVCLIGYIIKAQSPLIYGNIGFFEFLVNNLPHGFLGILVVGLLAAIMSTADSWLNNASVLLAHDVMKQLFPKINRIQEVWIARMSVLFISLIASFFALTNNQSLFKLGILALNLWEPVVLIPLIFGFFKLRTNDYSFIGACIIGIISALIGKYITGEFATISMTLGMIGSAIGLLSTHYIQKQMGLIVITEEESFTYSTSTSSSQSFFSQIKGLSLRKILNLVIKEANHEIEENGKIYAAGSMICGIYYVVSLFSWATILNASVDLSVLALKTIGAFAALGLYGYEYGLGNSNSRHLPIYYYIVLMWMFPMITMYTMYIYGLNTVWIVDLVFGMLALYALTGRRVMPILMTIGLILGCALGAMRLLYGEVYVSTPNVVVSSIYSVLLAFMLLLMVKVKDGMLQAVIKHEVQRANSIAHEVLQPISYVSLSAGTLTNAIGKYSQPVNPMYQVQHADLQVVNDISKGLTYAAEHGTHIVRNILAMSRNDMDKAEDIKEYDIQELLESALEIHLRLPERANRIQVELGNSFKVRGSKYFLVHAISNVIENSMKYAGKNAVLKIWCQDRKLHLRDNGVGIEASKMPTIFNKYKNLDGKIEGTGLGMNFCKKVIEAYGGSIKASSKKREFMEITFIFPALKE